MTIGGGGSISDPSSLAESLAIGGGIGLRRYYTLDSKGAPISPVLAAEVTTVLIGGPTQSMETNVIIVSTYSPSHAKNQNLSVDNGAIYTASDPLLGCSDSGSNVLTRLGDKLITDGKTDRTIIVPIGMNGSRGAEWAKGGICNPALTAAVYRCNALGLLAATHVFAICGLGPTDGNLGTSQATMQAYYTSMFTTLTDAMTACGHSSTIKIFIAKNQTWLGGATSATIQAAQTAMVDNVTVFAGGNMDSLNAANRDAGNTHWNDAGATNASALWAAALELQM